MSRILVVDDETIIAMQLEACLASLGHEVVGSAMTGREAVEMAEKYRPELILMDIKMPGDLDGIGAAEIIRARLNIPVIFVTAYAEDPLIERAKQVVPLAYIAKPFQTSEVKAAIEVAAFRMEVEKQLIETKERYVLATTAGRVGIWDWDLESGTVYLEPILREMLGYGHSKERYNLDEWLQMVHPDDRAAVTSNFEEYLRGRRESIEMERRMVHQEGFALWFLARGKRIRDESGASVRVMGTDADITDRKLAEGELRRSRERFRNLVETTGDFIWEINRFHRFTYASPQAEKILGYSSPELIGKKPYQLMPTDQGMDLGERITAMAETGEPMDSTENVFMHRDGREVVLESRAVPFFDGKRVLAGFRGISRDVTDRRFMEEALRHSHRELEERVTERTQELLTTTKELEKRQMELSRHKTNLELMNQQLADSNSALSLMAKHLERNREDAERRIAGIIRSKVLPIIGRMGDGPHDGVRDLEVETLSSYMHELVGSLGAGAEIAGAISETEWKVATKIKEGKTSGEIAKELGLSVDTIKTHRKNIRRKLNLQNSRVNLTTYLQTKLS